MMVFTVSANLVPAFASSLSVSCLRFPSFCPLFSRGTPSSKSRVLSKRNSIVFCSPSEIKLSKAEEEWLNKLPEKKKPLYSHSLPSLEAWLKKLGFCQSKEDRAVWFIEKPDWHAQLSLDITDLYIRYLTTGPGNLEKDVERRFSYALSREDIENAILGGP